MKRVSILLLTSFSKPSSITQILRALRQRTSYFPFVGSVDWDVSVAVFGHDGLDGFGHEVDAEDADCGGAVAAHGDGGVAHYEGVGDFYALRGEGRGGEGGEEGGTC